MSQTPVQETRNKLAIAYAAGVAAFIAIFGSVTLLALFLARVNLG